MVNRLIDFLVKVLKFIKRRVLFIKYKFEYKEVGKDARVFNQLLITNKKFISLGKRVVLMPNSRIELIDRYAGETFNPKLKIGDDSQIHQNCHITCADSIKIGKNVIVVANVTITDIVHPHDDISTPINKAKIKTYPVEINDESYIYNNSVILPGVKIGRHTIIGANSVVNSDIPDYSIAVGNPAKVIKKYNFKTKCWEKVS